VGSLEPCGQRGRFPIDRLHQRRDLRAEASSPMRG
jgi:hypothetical protein